MKFILGVDIGNDKLKALEPNMENVFKMPNVYRRVVKALPSQEFDVQKNVDNLLSQLVVHITSDAIKRLGKFIIGEKALDTTEGVRNMDISHEDKHTSDLPIINTLGYIAARAVQKHYRENGTLPTESLEVETYLSCAIPASQHDAQTASHLEKRFTEHTHIVVVYVGNELVTVQIRFNTAKVTKEGIPALYAIFEGPKDMFEQFGKTYNLPNTDGKYFMDKKIMHNDIGAGTIEYIYSVGVNARPNQCAGARLGVGHAILNAIEIFEDERKGTQINRQQFSKIIENPSEYPKDYELAAECLKEARISQVEAILIDIEGKYVTKMNSEAEIIAVYGGGSIEFEPDMYADLKDYADKMGAKLLWIPAKYAVDMNVNGLNILNKKMFFKELYEELENSGE